MGASRVIELVERSAPCAMMNPEYNTRGFGSTRHHRQKLRMVVFLVIVFLPVSTAFSSPAARSALFASQTRLRFIERQISISPANFNTNNNNARSKNVRQSTSTSMFANSDAHQLFPDFFPHVPVSRTDKISLILMAVATALAFVALLSVAGPGSWRYFAAGGICAATSHAVTTPIDVVKTRKQVDPGLRKKGFLEASAHLVKTEGAHSLLAGLGPTMVGYLLEGAVKFGIYEILKPGIRTFLSSLATASGKAFLDSNAIGFVLCGAASGVAASVMLCPMEAIRIRQVAEPNFAPGGWVQAGLKMVKNEHIFGLWKGMTPMLYKQVPYTVTKNVSFDFLTKFAYATVRNSGIAMSTTTSVMVPLISAFVASILSCISSQPGDTLLSLVNAHEGTKNANDFVLEISKSKRGLRGLFVGTNARFLHVGIIVTVQLLIYDFIKRLVGIAATGSV